MIAKYMHDFNYFRSIKEYAEINHKQDVKIDLIFNLPIFLIELFTFFRVLGISSEEIKQGLEAEIKRKFTKYSPFKAKLYLLWFPILARLYFLKYERILRVGKYDTICLFGGFHIAQRMAILVAKKLDIKVFYFENGLLPNTTVMDSKGTNFNNSIPREFNFYKPIEPNFQTISLVARAPAKQMQQHSVSLPKYYIFCPFQVALDTQILVHSPWVKNMAEFYRIIEELVKNTPRELFFVIKEHPSDFKDYSYLHHKNERIIFATTNNTQELIENSQAIITINSTVGIEGMIYGKKIITIGNAFYSGYGFAKKAENFQELLEIVQNLQNWNVNQEDILKFLTYLQHIYLVQGNWKTPNEAHLEDVCRRLAR